MACQMQITAFKNHKKPWINEVEYYFQVQQLTIKMYIGTGFARFKHRWIGGLKSVCNL